MKTRNVLLIIPEMSMGGAQRSLFKLSAELQRYYHVTVVVFNRNYEEAAAMPGPVHSLDVQSGNSVWVKLKAFYSRVRKLRELKDKLETDVAISFLEGADYINILSKRSERVILSVRGSKMYDENMRRKNFNLRRFLIRSLYRKADAIVCVNAGIVREIKDSYHIDHASITVIPNFYNLEHIAELSRLPLPAGVQDLFSHQVITMSGRLAVEKGNLFVLEVFSELKKVRPQLRLLLIGDGPVRNDIIEQSESLGLKVAYRQFATSIIPDVFITGDQQNVFNLVRASTLYLLNSSSEGFPNGLAEAMACGVPVISSDCPYGPGEILRSTNRKSTGKVEFAEYGVLLPLVEERFRVAAKEEWKRVISQMLDDMELRERYSEAGLKRMAHFATDEIINSWRRVIENGPVN